MAHWVWAESESFSNDNVRTKRGDGTSNRSQIGNGKVHGATKEDAKIELFNGARLLCVRSTVKMKKKKISITFGKKEKKKNKKKSQAFQ